MSLFSKKRKVGAFRFGMPIRILSLCLISTMLLQTVGFAAPDTVTYGDLTPSGNLIRVEGHDLRGLRDFPENFGRIKRAYKGTGSHRIIQIQDAHASREGQRHTAKLIEYFSKKYDTHLVLLEGASGVLSHTMFSSYPHEPSRRLTADYFMNQGMISGAEYLAWTSRPDIQLYGIEDNELYEENRTVFLRMLEIEKKNAKTLEDLRAGLEQAASKIFQPEITAMMRLKNASEKSGGALLEYSRYLKELLRKHFPTESFYLLDQFLALAAVSQNEGLPGGEQKIKDLSEGFFEDLIRGETILKANMLETAAQKNMESLLRLLEVHEKLFALSLTKENAEFFYANHGEFDGDVFPKQVLDVFYEYGIRSDLDSKTLEGLSRDLKTAEHFYELVLKRDEVLSQRALERMRAGGDKTAILITGGFHTPGIENRLKENGVSYWVVEPSLGNMANEQQEKNLYEQNMNPGISRLGKILSKTYENKQSVFQKDPMFQLQTPRLMPSVDALRGLEAQTPQDLQIALKGSAPLDFAYQALLLMGLEHIRLTGRVHPEILEPLQQVLSAPEKRFEIPLLSLLHDSNAVISTGGPDAGAYLSATHSEFSYAVGASWKTVLTAVAAPPKRFEQGFEIAMPDGMILKTSIISEPAVYASMRRGVQGRIFKPGPDTKRSESRKEAIAEFELSLAEVPLPDQAALSRIFNSTKFQKKLSASIKQASSPNTRTITVHASPTDEKSEMGFRFYRIRFESQSFLLKIKQAEMPAAQKTPNPDRTPAPVISAPAMKVPEKTGLLTRISPELLGGALGFLIYGFAPQAFMMGLALSALFRAGYIGSLLTHEWSHLISAFFQKGVRGVFTSQNVLGNRALKEWLKGFFPLQTLPPGAYVFIPDIGFEASVSRAGWMGTLLFFSLSAGLAGLASAFSIPWLFPLLFFSVTAGAAWILVKSVSPWVDPEAECGVYGCGNYGGMMVQGSEGLSLNEFGDLVEEMSRLEVTRGEQADGEAGYLTDGKQLTHVRKRIVKTRRGKIPKVMRKSYEQSIQQKKVIHAFVSPLSGRLKYPTVVTRQGHSRFGTTSRPSVTETQPHMGLPERKAIVWTVSGGEYQSGKRNVATIVSHNGDFDTWKLFGQEVPYDVLQGWFGKVLGKEVRVAEKTLFQRGISFLNRTFFLAVSGSGVFLLLHVLIPGISLGAALAVSFAAGAGFLFSAQKMLRVLTKKKVPTGDTPRLAEAIDFCFTRGMWDASIRLAYQFSVAQSLEDKAPSPQELNEWGRSFDEVLKKVIQSGQLHAGPDGFSNPEFRSKSAVNLTEQLKEAILSQPAFRSWIPQNRMDAFLEEAVAAFFENDLYHAVQIAKKRAEGSFGMVVTSPLEPGKVVFVASSQPMSLAFYPKYNLTLWSSEAAAVKVRFKANRESTTMPYRFDLDQGTGEIIEMEIEQGQKPKLRVYSEYLGRELSLEEVAETGRVIDMRNNPMIDALPDFDWDDLVGRDISEISQVLDKIRRTWRSRDKKSPNPKTAEAFFEFLNEKDIQKRIEEGINRKRLPQSVVKIIEQTSAVLSRKFISAEITENELARAIQAAIDKSSQLLDRREAFSRGVLAPQEEEDETAETTFQQRTEKMLRDVSESVNFLSDASDPRVLQHDAVDVLVTGFEVSQWLGEQFALDLHKMFPHLKIESVSSNKILNAIKNANLKRNHGEFLIEEHNRAFRVGRQTLVLAISQGGQTFGTLNAVIALTHILPGRIFVMTGGTDTLIGWETMRATSGSRIFDNQSGMRPAEPTSVAVAAAHATLTELLLYLGTAARKFYSDRRRPLGMLYEEEDFEILRSARDDVANHSMPAITGFSTRGPEETVQSPVKKNLLLLAKRWTQHILEYSIVTLIVAFVVSSLVHFGIPFFPGQFSGFPRPSWAMDFFFKHVLMEQTALAGAVADALWLIPVGAAYFIGFSYPFLLALRAIQGRFPLFQRTGKRTLTIGALPFVHQILEMFVSKIFALSYGFASLDVHGGNPRDHFLARFSHRVVRGSLLLLFRPDGRLGTQSGNQSAVDMTKSQAEGIESFKVGAEVWTIGRNPKTKPSTSGGNVVLPDSSDAVKISHEKLVIQMTEALSLNSEQVLKAQEALENLGERYAGKTISQTVGLIAGTLGLTPKQFKYFEDLFYDFAERQFAVEQFYDSRFDSLEGMVAGFVVFEAIGRKVSRFFKWLGLVYDMAASQSRTRSFTTRSPVSAADIRDLIDTMKEIREAEKSPGLENPAEAVKRISSPRIKPEDFPFEVISPTSPATVVLKLAGEPDSVASPEYPKAAANEPRNSGGGEKKSAKGRSESREENQTAMLEALGEKTKWQNFLLMKESLRGDSLASALGLEIPSTEVSARMLLINYQPGVLNEAETLGMIRALSLEKYQPTLAFYQDASAGDDEWKHFISAVRAAASNGMHLEFASQREYSSLSDYLEKVSLRYGFPKSGMIQILHPGLTGKTVTRETLAVLNGALALSENTVVLLGKTESVAGVFHVGAVKFVETLLAARQAVATAA